MRFINIYTQKQFTLDGVPHLRRYFSRVYGNKITIFNAYNPDDILLDPIDYSQITLNGVVYGSASELQGFLLGNIFLSNLTDMDGNFTGDGSTIIVDNPVTGTESTLNEALESLAEEIGDTAIVDYDQALENGNTATNKTAKHVNTYEDILDARTTEVSAEGISSYPSFVPDIEDTFYNMSYMNTQGFTASDPIGAFTSVLNRMFLEFTKNDYIASAYLGRLRLGMENPTTAEFNTFTQLFRHVNGYVATEAWVAENIGLSDVMAVNNEMSTNLDANAYQIKELANASDNNDAVNLGQLNAAILEAVTNLQSMIVGGIVLRGSYDIVTLQEYPETGGTGVDGAIMAGNAFRVPSGGYSAFNDTTYDKGDIFYALEDNPAQDQSKWSELDHNTQQATTTTRGTMMLAETTDANNPSTTNNVDAITPQLLWSTFWNAALNKTNTWVAKQTFNQTLRLTSLTGSKYLKTDSNKDIVEVSAIPATDVTEDSTKVFVTPEQKASIINKDEFFFFDTTPRTVTGVTGQTAFQFYTVAANTWQVGSMIEGFLSVTKSNVDVTSGNILRLGVNSTNAVQTTNNFAMLNAAANILDMSLKFTAVVVTGNKLLITIQPTTSVGAGSSTSTTVLLDFNPTVVNYIYASIIPNVGTASFTQNLLYVRGKR